MNQFSRTPAPKPQAADNPKPCSVPMRRHAIGIIAVLLILGAVVFWVREWGRDYPQLEGACWRVGALMAVLWLGYHELHRLPAWLWGVLPVLLVVLALRPRWFLFFLPLLLLLALVWPRSGGARKPER